MGCSATKQPPPPKGVTDPVSKGGEQDEKALGNKDSAFHGEYGTNPHTERNPLNDSTGGDDETVAAVDEAGDKSMVNQSSRLSSVNEDDDRVDVENAEQALLDVDRLHEILQKLEVDVEMLTKLMIPRSTSYQQLLRSTYEEKYKEDLVKCIGHKTTDITQYFLTSSMLRPDEFLASLLKKHVSNKSYILLVEALTVCEPKIVADAKLNYSQRYGSTFSEDLKQSLSSGDTPKGLKDICLSTSSLDRSRTDVQDDDAIKIAADCLSQGSDEITEILTRRPYSRATLASIFEQYKIRYYLDIADSIDIEFHDDSQLVLTNMVQIANNCDGYLARQLQKAIETKNLDRVVDILISTRHTVNIKTIAKLYEDDHHLSLKNDTIPLCPVIMSAFFQYHLNKAV